MRRGESAIFHTELTAQNMADLWTATQGLGAVADTVAGTLYDLDGVTPVEGHVTLLNADTRAFVANAAVASGGAYSFGSLTPAQKYILTGWNTAGTLVKSGIVTPEVA